MRHVCAGRELPVLCIAAVLLLGQDQCSEGAGELLATITDVMR